MSNQAWEYIANHIWSFIEAKDRCKQKYGVGWKYCEPDGCTVIRGNAYNCGACK